MLSSKRELIQAITKGYRKSRPPLEQAPPWNTLLFKASVRYHSKYVTTTSIPIRTQPRFRSTPYLLFISSLSPVYPLFISSSLSLSSLSVISSQRPHADASRSV